MIIWSEVHLTFGCDSGRRVAFCVALLCSVNSRLPGWWSIKLILDIRSVFFGSSWRNPLYLIHEAEIFRSKLLKNHRFCHYVCCTCFIVFVVLHLLHAWYEMRVLEGKVPHRWLLCFQYLTTGIDVQNAFLCDSNCLLNDLELIIIEVAILLDRRQLVHFAGYHLLGTDLQTLQPAIVRMRPALTALCDEGLAQGLLLVVRL